MAIHISLEERVHKFSQEDRETLQELRYRCGDYRYSQSSAEKLVKLGLATWVGGEAFITDTSKRTLLYLDNN